MRSFNEDASTFQLTDRMIHVWVIPIQVSEEIVAECRALLSPDEQARAARFQFEHLRQGFVLTRCALRMLLGGYLNTAPANIQLLYGTKGKPRLAAEEHVCFNISHSGALALFAFTLKCELGVDVERIRPVADMEGIASRFFCAEEASELMSIPADEREQAFFQCWTRKEAYLKAQGKGLTTPLDSFRVTLGPSEPARVIHIGQDRGAANEWILFDLDLGIQYKAAVAYRDRVRPVRVLQLVSPAQLLGPPGKVR